MLERYALGRDATPEDIHPTNNAPPFLFKDDFNSWRDTPKYRFADKNDLLHRVKARLKEPQLAARIKKMDKAFNIVVAPLAIAYFAVQGLRLGAPGWMPLPLFVIAMVVLRSSLVGFGHYAIHRAQRGITRVTASTFDMNYVALALVVADGHTLLHHPHTQSEVDIKKNVFTMMMRLPRLYRIPVHTIHKFGHMSTGICDPDRGCRQNHAQGRGPQGGLRKLAQRAAPLRRVSRRAAATHRRAGGVHVGG